MGRIAYLTLIDFLRDAPGGSAFVSINFCCECAIAGKAIEELLVQAKMNRYVLLINGDMDKNESSQ